MWKYNLYMPCNGETHFSDESIQIVTCLPKAYNKYIVKFDANFFSVSLTNEDSFETKSYVKNLFSF
jgi:hypothetical protein